MSQAYQLFQQGLSALALGRADEAIVPLERAKRLEPDSMSVVEALGKTYLRIGFYDRAVEEFRTIVQREPLDAYAHFCLARAYDRLGTVGEARHHYRLATTFAPHREIYRNTMQLFLLRNFPESIAE